MSRSRRAMYKPNRPPARDAGVFSGPHLNAICKFAPIGCPDANAGEVVRVLRSIGKEAGVSVARGCGYEPLRDEYTVVGKSLLTGKAQDFKIKGEAVAAVIMMARGLNGGPMVHGALRAAVH